MSTPPESARPPGASRYGWFVGVVVVLVLAYISLNTLRTGPDALEPDRGERLAPFAVPELFADTGDATANVLREEANGVPAACDVRSPRAVNVCRYAAGRPLVLAFASVEDDDSLAQLDVLQRLAPRFPGARFVGVFLRGDRDEAREEARRRGWGFPLGWDPEADVAAIYGIKALPALFLADRRRRARGREYRLVGAPELARRLRRAG